MSHQIAWSYLEVNLSSCDLPSLLVQSSSQVSNGKNTFLLAAQGEAGQRGGEEQGVTQVALWISTRAVQSCNLAACWLPSSDVTPACDLPGENTDTAVSGLLPFIKILSSCRKWVGEHRQEKPLKVAQLEFLTVPLRAGGRQLSVTKHAAECCKRQLIFLSFGNTCKCFVVQMKLHLPYSFRPLV